MTEKKTQPEDFADRSWRAMTEPWTLTPAPVVLIVSTRSESNSKPRGLVVVKAKAKDEVEKT